MLHRHHHISVSHYVDGLRPSWQPAIISTFFHLLLYMIYLANKIVVVVVDYWNNTLLHSAVHC